MLTNFPAPYPDELFYSIIARYSKRVPETNDIRTIQDLFGKKMSILGKSIPYGIHGILNKLKIFDYPSDIDILKNHTHYNYYNNFNSPIATNKFFSKVLIGEKQFSRTVSNGMNLLHGPNFFRYCPRCLQEDINNYGETYWRTICQLPTVFVCKKHKVLLEDSSVSYYTKGLVPATEDNCCNPLSSNKRITKKTLSLLLILAVESERLVKEEINFYFKNTDLGVSQLKYKNLINRHGQINKEELSKQFFKFYGFEFFKIVGHNTEMVIDIYESASYNIGYLSYLEQLLIIIFLAGSIKNYITTPISIPNDKMSEISICKNKFCKNKTNIKLQVDNEEKNTTTLSYDCECGMHFHSIYGDREIFERSSYYYFYSKDITRIVYEEVYNKGLIISQVATKLNVHVLDIETVLHRDIKEKTNLSDYKKFRREWTRLIIDNPNKHYLELKYEFLPIYAWLYRNDNQWLSRSLQKLNNNEISSDFIKKRDFMLKEYLRSTLYRLLIFRNKGRKICISMSHPFIRDYYLSNELIYFPKTAAYINMFKQIYDKFSFKEYKGLYS